MATHSSVLAWRIPGMGEPGGLPSMGSHRVGHDKPLSSSNQKSVLNIHWKDWCWSWSSNTLAMMRRTDSFEKTLMLGKIEGRKRRGQQRMRQLNGITDSMEMSLGKLPKLEMDRVAWHAAVHRVTKSQTWLSDWTELNWMALKYKIPCFLMRVTFFRSLLAVYVLSNVKCLFLSFLIFLGSFS